MSMPWVIMCNGTATRPRTAPGPNLSPAFADAERNADKTGDSNGFSDCAADKCLAHQCLAHDRSPAHCRGMNDQTRQKFLGRQGDALSQFATRDGCGGGPNSAPLWGCHTQH